MAAARERWREAGRQAGREVGVFLERGLVVGAGEGLGGREGGRERRLFLSRAEINHGAEAIMCNSTPARLVTLVT